MTETTRSRSAMVLMLLVSIVVASVKFCFVMQRS